MAKKRLTRVHVLKNRIEFDEEYGFDPSFIPARRAMEAHTTFEMVKFLKRDPTIDIEAKVWVKERDGEFRPMTMNREQFLEHFDRQANVEFTESQITSLIEGDPWGSDSWCWGNGAVGFGANSTLIGHDYVPLLSGPFYKQLYYYDYLRMHALAFHAYHHDPVAKRAIDMIVHFTLGRGYKVAFKDPEAQAYWEAFAEANNLNRRFEHIATELLLFGEQFLWWLPNNQKNITWMIRPGQEAKKGILPMLRTIDPSVLWEIVTYPEDIERVLYYQWVAPTQYQLYTGIDKGQPVPSLKFIWQQIPDAQVDHFKFNCVSNEKRGRSILFPIFGDLKRLRDTINYSIAGLQKTAAWSIDTTIEGSQADIDAYVQDQQSMGTIPDAGSEFVHTAKVKRDYLGMSAAGGSRGANNGAFDWALSRISMGIGIPISYLGTHLSGGTTKASAIVATEPVAKLFEYVQNFYERMLRKMAERVMDEFGKDIEAVEMEVTFPEIITQDRSAKLKDIFLAQTEGWIAKERAATMAAKELNITEYEYGSEKDSIDKETQDSMAQMQPLTTPGASGSMPKPAGVPSAQASPQAGNLQVPQPPQAPGSSFQDQPSKPTSAVTSGQKRAANQAR